MAERSPTSRKWNVPPQHRKRPDFVCASEGVYAELVATETIIRRRVPAFEAVISTNVPYDIVSRILEEAFTSDPRFDALLAFGFRYSGQMKGPEFWLRHVTDPGRQNPTVVNGALKETPTGVDITLQAHNPLRRVLKSTVLATLPVALIMTLTEGTSWIYANITIALAIVGIVTGWRVLTPWMDGSRALRDLTFLIDSKTPS